MRTLGAFLLALGLGAATAAVAVPAEAAGKSGKAPSASGDEVNKLKAIRLGDPKAGIFKWNMSPDEVIAQLKASIEARYQQRIGESATDPGMQQRIRAEMKKEMEAVEKSLIRFEGQKSGLDVSIVGPEFQQNTGEAVVQAKEDIWTRYFFFFENGLYKVFLAFNKDAIAGKTFADFGKDMQGKFGKSREVFRDEKVKNGVRRILDHYEWNAQADRLKLIDRSEFYDVFCLVLFDGKTNDRVNAKRKIVNPGLSTRDALVEAVTAKDKNDRDSNDNIVDRFTGKEVKKPGDDRPQDIVVPSPSGGGAAASPPPEPAPAPAPANEKGKKTAGKHGKKDPNHGLDL